MPLHAWESCPGTALPTPVARPSPPLCDAVLRGQQPPRGTVPPTPVQPTHRTLEKGQRNPRRNDARLLRSRTGPRRDVRPVGAVTSVAISPMRPSPPPHAIPATASPYLMLWKHAATGHRHTSHCALYSLMSTAPSNPHVDGPQTSNLYATPLKPLLGAHRTHHDAPPEAGFARMAVYSMALYAMPPHVARTVCHACKLPPPWPIKGGAAP
jgi:hypothetical protein